MFATLADVRAHLNTTSTADDAELQEVLDAAEERVRALVGSFDATPVSERHTPADGVVVLNRRGVVGDVTVVDDYGTAFPDHIVGRAAGLLYHVWTRSAVTVTYTAGDGLVPASVRLATIITAAHLWETQRGPAQSPIAAADQGFGDSLPEPSGQGYALPYRARELLEPFIHEAQVA